MCFPGLIRRGLLALHQWETLPKEFSTSPGSPFDLQEFENGGKIPNHFDSLYELEILS